MIRHLWPFRSHGRLQARLIVLVAIAMATVLGADTINLLSHRKQAIRAAEAETDNLSRSLADQAHGVVQTLDTILVGLRERVETDGTGPVALARLARLLQLRADALPMVHRLLVVDVAGHVIVASGPSGPGPDAAALATRERVLMPPTADLGRSAHLGRPVRDPLDGIWVVPVTRRVDHADGSFAGMVIASVATSFFRQTYASFHTGSGGMILLARADGVSIARWPPDPRGEATDISKGDLFSRIMGPGDRAQFTFVSQADGIARFASYHRLADAPALVLVGRERHDVLAAWTVTVRAHMIGLAAVLGVLALLGQNLARKIGQGERAHDDLCRTNQRLGQSEARTRLANDWLQMAEQIAQVGHWQFDLPGDPSSADAGNDMQVNWSDEVYRIHGVDRGVFLPRLGNAIEAYHPSDRAKVGAAVAAAMQATTPFEINARIIRPDGGTRHVLTKGLPQINAQGVVTGVFGIFVDMTAQKHAEAALLIAQSESHAANLALEAANRALQAMAMQDALTQLANRRYFDRALDHEFRRAARLSSSLALVLIDVDQFKQYNDIYGHQAGDACLRAIAAIIPPLLNRPGDTASRYGGEELAVLLPGNTEGGAMALAHRIAAGVRELAIPHIGSMHQVVTISAGVEAFVPVHEQATSAELVAHADRALYAAKRAGRDCVLGYRDVVPAAVPEVIE